MISSLVRINQTVNQDTLVAQVANESETHRGGDID